MSLERHEGVHFHALVAQLSCAADIGQVDDEGRCHDIAAGFAEEIDGGGGRAAGSDQIVDQEDPVTLPNGVGVNLDGVDAVFERIFLAEVAVMQLAPLGNRNESPSLFNDAAPAENEAA